MEKDIKYYTPTIEEFYVGFEYEMKERFTDGTVKTQENFDNAKWVKNIFKVGDCPYIERALNGRNSENGICGIRIKCLDENDIIDLKFVEENCLDSYNEDEIKEGFKLSIDDNTTIVLIKYGNNKISIVKEYCYNDYSGNTEITFLFYGTIKNKSELKKTLKMLNIE